jgi:uncharacterized protein (UPF0147 family)
LQILSFKQSQKKKSQGLIKVRWTCWPNITADNSVPENIRQSLHRHTCIVDSSWVSLAESSHRVFLLLLTLDIIVREWSVHIFRN